MSVNGQNKPTTSRSGKHFFLLSFLPAIAYWYLETRYPIKIAVLGGIALAVIEIAFEKIWAKKIHQLSLFNFFLMLILGLFALASDDGLWFKLQPFFTGVILAIYLLIQLKRKKGLMKTMIVEMNPNLQVPDWILDTFERNLAILLLVHACSMGFVALYASTGIWTFMKTTGIYILFIPFVIGHFLWIRFRSKQIQKQMILSSLMNANRVKHQTVKSPERSDRKF